MNIFFKIFLIIILLFLGFCIGFFYFNNKIINLDDNQQIENGALTDEQLKEKIGQMLMVGFRGIEAPEDYYIYNVIKDVKVGSVILSDYDVPSKSFPRNIINPEQTKKLISNLQRYTDTPLFVAVDVEGGMVNRLKEKYGFSSIISAEKMGDDKTLETVNEESIKLAKELRDLGFNLNLAPVVDVNINPNNPIIGILGRSFSSSPEIVINNARIFIQNHIDKDIITVEKHFPGHGSSTKDSHLGLVDITNTYNKEKELIPYQKLNDEGLLNMVMTAHIINRNIDKDYPATLSKIFLQDILRDQIGFEGVIISDDIQMSAISDMYGFEEAIIMAVNAGCDIINVYNNSTEYDETAIYKARDAIFNAVKEDRIKEEKIIESYNRILNLKKKFNLYEPKNNIFLEDFEINEKITEISSENFELIGEPNTLTFGEALEYAKYVEDVTEIDPAFLLAILKHEMNLVKEFGLCYVTDLETGEGIKVDNDEKMSKVIKPERDVEPFLKITKDLGLDPYKTPITCPMSFGWGGAMGVADFIPSTWARYEDRVKNIIGRPANPWNIRDSFLVAGLYLSESGASLRTRQGEWNAAMIYFSGSTKSGYNWYANDALAIADEIRSKIKTIENNK
ncbi:MAG: glycoside hydrolase family 3 N-terminal domain-containing protein [Candidatus Pacebacteria bacterium]|jgi:beta-N-acetylhexosaminidase|nr:glycoside hydrolase family 3 N-terminal domain-containing protein [Candidatus Paceibacterota bacterium]MDD5012778.1 glycoside hydrolase family 3 N-terminal domain-containing protein [Candidatus Paceibacterota bacterium]MDD5752828.1 glycoside hydrolase family 3 N-terminal domain-containing protein [Candidatus Paceibacterota bacterium]